MDQSSDLYCGEPIALSRQDLERFRDLWHKSAKTPSAMHTRGILLLASGDIERSIPWIEKAALADPNQARFWNDLGVAYVTRSQDDENRRELFRGLDCIERAVRLAPSSRAFRFNQALAVQHVLLGEVSDRAWNRYLDTETDVGWVQEAKALRSAARKLRGRRRWPGKREQLLQADFRLHAEELTGIIRSFSQQSRLLVEEELLGSWARHEREGRPREAAMDLARARFITGALADLGLGDTLEQVVVLLRSAAPGSAYLRKYQKAWEAYSDGLALYKKRRIDEARPLLEAAAGHFHDLESTVTGWPKLYLAACLIHQGRLAEAERDLLILRSELDLSASPSLLGRTDWMLAAALLLQGKPAESLAAFARARASFEASMDREDLAAILHHSALNLRYVGQKSSTWPFLYSALELTPYITSWTRYSALLEEVISTLIEANLSYAASLFVDELFRTATEVEDQEATAQALRRRVELALNRQELSVAEANLKQAWSVAQTISEPAIRHRMSANLNALRGEILLRRRDHSKAVTELNQALERFRSTGIELDSAPLHLSLARAQIASGQVAEAKRSLQRGIELTEAQRESLAEARLRETLFDRAQEVFDELLLIEARETADGLSSLAVVERARARLVLDNLVNKNRQAAAFESELLLDRTLESSLSSEIRIIRYALLSDRVLIWVIGNGMHEMRSNNVKADRIVELVEERLLQDRNEGPSRTALFYLYNELFEPVKDLVPPESRIIFVPDRELFAVPFTALVSETDRFLIEDYEILTAPSVMALRTGLGRRPPETASAIDFGMVMGASHARAASYLGLPDLPGAAEEARRVARLLPRSELLLGTRANRSNFFEMARTANLIHFAGHAVSNARDPDLSFLILANPAAAESETFLYGRDIAKLELKHHPLVVLSACSTAAGRTSRGEAPFSLATSFIEAGARSVVASLWPIDDVGTRRFFEEFYSAEPLVRGTAWALRRAVLALKEAEDPIERSPTNWAAFQVISLDIHTN